MKTMSVIPSETPLSAAEWLSQLEAIVLEIDQGLPNARAKLKELRSHLADQRLNVAVVGQFKRGKSTLLNALLGEELSPAGILPLTTAPVFVGAGRARRLRVVYSDHRLPTEIVSLTAAVLAQKLRDLVSEERNPLNHLGIEAIEIDHPAALLGNGIILIDTPGIGSTLEHNTSAAVAVLPKCDTAVFVVSADPPITRQEIDFLRLVQPHAQRIVVVLNKIDLLTPAERAASIAFLENALAQAGLKPVPPVIPVSAKQALAAKQNQDASGLNRSGLPELENYLATSIAAERQSLLDQSVIVKAKQVLDLCRTSLSVSLRAFDLDVDDLEKRLDAFGAVVTTIEAERGRTQDILVGDRKRLFALVEQAAAELRSSADAKLKAVAEDALNKSSEVGGVLSSIEAVIPEIFDEARLEWLGWVTAELRNVLGRHAAGLAKALEQIQGTASTIFDAVLPTLSAPQAVNMERDPYWIKAKIDPIFGPLVSGLIDALLPPAIRRRRVHDRVIQRCRELVVTNVENLRWSTRQNIEATLRQFSGQFDRHVSEASGTIKAAVRQTLIDRRTFSKASEPTLQLLRQKLSLLDRLAQQGPPDGDATYPPETPA